MKELLDEIRKLPMGYILPLHRLCTIVSNFWIYNSTTLHG